MNHKLTNPKADTAKTSKATVNHNPKNPKADTAKTSKAMVDHKPGADSSLEVSKAAVDRKAAVDHKPVELLDAVQELIVLGMAMAFVCRRALRRRQRKLRLKLSQLRLRRSLAVTKIHCYSRLLGHKWELR